MEKAVPLSTIQPSKLPLSNPLLVIFPDAGEAITVTVLEAILAPSLVSAVIVAVPSDFPVTTPLTTDATDVLLELHITFLFVAFAGATVA
ncbi:hypothetical protein D3C87_945140 [compost metagenome]